MIEIGNGPGADALPPLSSDMRERYLRLVQNSLDGTICEDPTPPSDECAARVTRTFHAYTELRVSLEQVRENFRRMDLLNDRVVFVKGWFMDTMPEVPSEQIAVLRLDGDMYESTIDPLEYLYDRIPDGGWVIVDDYHVVEAARNATHDFLDGRNITDVKMREIDGIGVCFRKNEAGFLKARARADEVAREAQTKSGPGSPENGKNSAGTPVAHPQDPS